MVCPQDALAASKTGLSLWFTQLVPTLLPFCILSYVVLASGLLPRRLGKWYVILCGFLFGFPIGSKLTADLYQKKLLSQRETSVLCVFTNNLSPVFVTCALQDLLALPASPKLLALVYGIPFLYGMAALALLQKQGKTPESVQKETAPRFRMDLQIVDAGILSGFETLLKLCGYVMFFAILCAMLRCFPPLSGHALVWLTGILEVTNGMAALAAYPFAPEQTCACAVCLLSFGGVCGLFQAASVLHAAGLSMKPYLLQKALLTGLTACCTLLLFFFRLLL